MKVTNLLLKVTQKQYDFIRSITCNTINAKTFHKFQ